MTEMTLLMGGAVVHVSISSRLLTGREGIKVEVIRSCASFDFTLAAPDRSLPSC